VNNVASTVLDNKFYRIPGSRKFFNPKIPGLSRTQSRDFGINKIYLFNDRFSTFKNNIVHLLILWCVSLSQSPVRRGGAVVLELTCMFSSVSLLTELQTHPRFGLFSHRSYSVTERWAKADFRVSYICLCLVYRIKNRWICASFAILHISSLLRPTIQSPTFSTLVISTVYPCTITFYSVQRPLTTIYGFSV